MPWFSVVSYGVAAVVYAGMATILVGSYPGGRQASLLVAATLVSAVWAGAIAALIVVSDTVSLAALFALDALHILCWSAAVLSWLVSAWGRWLMAAELAGFAWVLLVSSLLGDSALGWTVQPTLIAMALVGFLAVEQVLRNAQAGQRRSLVLLCSATGGIFVVDIFVYSQAILLGELAPGFWDARGLVSAALAPLVVLAIKRQQEWERELFVSRQVMFYTASLLGVGGYFVAMGLLALLIRALGGGWSVLFEILFLVVALGLFVWVLFWTSIRARLKVFLVKHFYRNKYDYRDEWLRLTQSLGKTEDAQALNDSALQALARIIGSKQGDLWLTRDGQRYEWMASLDERLVPQNEIAVTNPIVQFLATSGWVIDSDEYALHPDLYRTSFGDPANRMLPPQSIIVPLDSLGSLVGFVALQRSPNLRSLNFEDHDLLKTAGKQAAVVLAQTLAQERLAETRQFEAMNKLSTFLMHDLKNVVAQQELVVANAQRFRHRPDFIDDAFATIRSGVERMKRVLEQLRSATRDEQVRGRVDVSKVLMEVRSQCSDRQPVPEIELGAPAAYVAMDRDELAAVLTHLLRNSQDATLPDGVIRVSLQNGGGELLITVADTGCGMDAAFVRDRLFRPFDSTKGAKGMGIGAYQVRHLIRSAGGEVEVRSEQGVGTTFKLRLPLVAA